MFPRLTLHACTLTCTISHSYRGISLSVHLVTEVFQIVTCYFTFPMRFQLNSNFSHTFINGKLTRCTIIIIYVYINLMSFFNDLTSEWTKDQIRVEKNCNHSLT